MVRLRVHAQVWHGEDISCSTRRWTLAQWLENIDDVLDAREQRGRGLLTAAAWQATLTTFQGASPHGNGDQSKAGAAHGNGDQSNAGAVETAPPKNDDDRVAAVSAAMLARKKRTAADDDDDDDDDESDDEAEDDAPPKRKRKSVPLRTPSKSMKKGMATPMKGKAKAKAATPMNGKAKAKASPKAKASTKEGTWLNEPSIGWERSRRQVMCRTGKSGKDTTLGMKFDDFGGPQKTWKKASEWLEKMMKTYRKAKSK